MHYNNIIKNDDLTCVNVVLTRQVLKISVCGFLYSYVAYVVYVAKAVALGLGLVGGGNRDSHMLVSTVNPM